MNWLQTTRLTIFHRLAMLAWVVSLSACVVLPTSGSDSWKEEVILQDGSRLIVSRTVERGGRHEFGQIPPIREQSVSFVHPQTGERIVWEDKPAPDINGANFLPMLVNIDKGVTDTVGIRFVDLGMSRAANVRVTLIHPASVEGRMRSELVGVPPMPPSSLAWTSQYPVGERAFDCRHPDAPTTRLPAPSARKTPP